MCSLTLWPGNIRSECGKLAAKRSGENLADAESVRFTGRCVVGLVDMPAEELMAYANTGTVIVADFNCAKYGGHDMDGFQHETRMLSKFEGRPKEPSAGLWVPEGSAGFVGF